VLLPEEWTAPARYFDAPTSRVSFETGRVHGKTASYGCAVHLEKHNRAGVLRLSRPGMCQPNKEAVNCLILA